MVKRNHLIPKEFNFIHLISQYRILCPGKDAVLSAVSILKQCQGSTFIQKSTRSNLLFISFETLCPPQHYFSCICTVWTVCSMRCHGLVGHIVFLTNSWYKNNNTVFISSITLANTQEVCTSPHTCNIPQSQTNVL